MKKFISIALVALMLLALALPAVAADLPSGTVIEGLLTGDVKVQVMYDDDDDPLTPPIGNLDAVYSVSVDWDGLDTFVFSGTWDAENIVYTGEWVNDEGTVTVTNSSNAVVKVNATIDTAEANGVTAALANTAFTLESAAKNGAATSDDITVTVSGNPKADSFTIGTITITLSTND